MGFTDLERILYAEQYNNWKASNWYRIRMARALDSVHNQTRFVREEYNESAFLHEISTRKQTQHINKEHE